MHPFQSTMSRESIKNHDWIVDSSLQFVYWNLPLKLYKKQTYLPSMLVNKSLPNMECFCIHLPMIVSNVEHTTHQAQLTRHCKFNNTSLSMIKILCSFMHFLWKVRKIITIKSTRLVFKIIGNIAKHYLPQSILIKTTYTWSWCHVQQGEAEDSVVRQEPWQEEEQQDVRVVVDEGNHGQTPHQQVCLVQMVAPSCWWQCQWCSQEPYGGTPTLPLPLALEKIYGMSAVQESWVKLKLKKQGVTYKKIL